ncbi:MAG: metallophosphatase [Dysgonamonadaceae bacterium]|jgi:5'-nucleotidase|nr:metallophosphatase [Dysgonamonadaceae bacterium]
MKKILHTSNSPLPILILILTLIAVPSAAQKKSIVILHLNDTHSRIEPLPEKNAQNAGKGGMARIYNYVEKVRQESDVLLFHCGDQVQGTPYFNFFNGKAETAIANLLRYDAACLGNHEFDNGIEFLAEMVRMAKFPIIATNLDFTGTAMEGLTKKYHIIKKNGLKIGIIGLTIDFKELVSKSNSKGAKYLDPIKTANKTAEFLKNKEKCNLVIVLSHLGYYPKENKIGDTQLAEQSRNIDLVLGGHTHTFMTKPVLCKNLDGKTVIINQTGAYGIFIGRVDIDFKLSHKK